jgi:amidase
MVRRSFIAAALAAATACTQTSPPAATSGGDDHRFLVEGPQPLTDIVAELAAGNVASAALVERFVARIGKVDDEGPRLNAVLSLNPAAAADAARIDDLRKSGGAPGPLQGAPILVKDNIETRDPVATTAGSLALQDNVTGRDAPAIARLRAAGAVILGKTNLSEWANFRSSASVSGWSAISGFTRNPHVLDRNPCGSSSGSAAAVAAGLAAAAIGTETDGSIICPAAANGIVGIKPTVGLVSRTHIVPISASQDTAGPMTLTVADAALLLTHMAGSDPSDPATIEADARRSDYTKALRTDALQGQRIGVARFLTGYHAATDVVFEQALEALQEAGAELVDLPQGPDAAAISEAEFAVLLAEFKAGLGVYLQTTTGRTPVRTVAELIAFNRRTPAETEWFGQETLEAAARAPLLSDPAYTRAAAEARRLAGPEGIDRLMTAAGVSAIVAPSGAPAWTTDAVNGDHFLGSASQLAAVAGYPHITVPMGEVRGLPVGLSLFGAKWSESALIGFAYAYEQVSRARITPEFRKSVE